MLKNGASWVYRGTSKLRLLGFIPWPQVPEHTQGLPEGTYPKLVCMPLSHAHSSRGFQAPGSRGLGVTSHSLLVPRFRSSEVLPWAGGGRSLLSSACQQRICWLNKAVSSSWLTAPFWSNLLTFFLIFLNSKH